MSSSDRSTSPDPLAQPSPLASRPGPLGIAAGRRSSKPLAPRSSNVASPSKSFIMDTGNAGEVSPWRIKVTVEAQPNEGSSPSKKVTRTTKVPLKGGSSSSPVKRSPRKKKAIADDESELDIKRPQRKRKGTPIRRAAKRSSPQEENERPTGEVVMSQALQEELSSPSKRPSPKTSNAKKPIFPTERTQRLTRARAELDDALQNAVGQQDDEDEDEDDAPLVHDYAAGDMTVANEDFTMISVETLESMKQNTSLLENSGIDQSVASVSYMPSSPPQSQASPCTENVEEVQYPSISAQANQAKAESSPQRVPVYDEMSWKPTTLAVERGAKPRSPAQRLDSEPTEWRLRRREVSHEINNANASQVIVINDDTQAGAHQSYSEEEQDGNAGGNELDIWAEEASRSLDEEEQVQDQQEEQVEQPAARSENLENLFSDQQQKPPRSKIPRTWRRSSGMDFSYVDSPEHGALKSRNVYDATDEESGGRSDAGVLTPPESSEDDLMKPVDDTGVQEGDTSLTQPDAAATMLQAQHRESVTRGVVSHAAENDEDSSLSDSSSSDASTPDRGGNDTGMFWQNNLPNAYQRRQRPMMQQRQKPKAMDLSELLNLNKTPAQEQSAPKDARQASSRTRALPQGSPAQSKNAGSQVDNSVSSSSKESAFSSPLNRSLPKSSKSDGNALPSSGAQRARQAYRSRSTLIEDTIQEEERQTSRHDSSRTENSFGDSFESKASDQRQLLEEMGMAPNRGRHSSSLRYQEDEKSKVNEVEHSQSYASNEEVETYGEDEESQYENEQYDQEESHAEHPTRSYEENLNLESPQKIKVKFNDSEGNSSLLAPKKEYPSIFNQTASASHNQQKSPPSEIHVNKRPASAAPAEPGIFSRLSTSFWSAIVRPSGPIFVEQKPEPEYSPSLRTQIRSRYGVLSDQHPWTMAHMRTLHRMLNSSESGRKDSLVPKSGPLPSALERLIGKELQCVTEFRWKFTEQHAHIANAFMQTLVPSHYTDAIRRGEVEFIGDYEAKNYRGVLGGRHPDDNPFDDFPDLELPKGTIHRDFVVKAVGNCVSANIVTAQQDAAEAAEKTRIAAERTAWERRNGMYYEDDSEDESTFHSSEVMPKVRRD